MKARLLHEVSLIKTGQACALLEEALEESSNRRYVFNRLQCLLRKYSAEIVDKERDG